MGTRYLKLIVAVLVAFAMCGCVYDFMPEGDDIPGLNDPLLVIEGDIIAGGVTKVRLGYSRELAENGQQVPDSRGISVWVESEDGKIWNGEPSLLEEGEFIVDTEKLPLDGRYRLCVSIPDKGEYHSRFKPVAIAPQIDSITYYVTEDRSALQLEVTTHNDGSEPLYCRWTFSEDWESNAEYPPALGMRKVDRDVELYELTEEEQKERSVCYSKGSSKGIYIAQTERLAQNVISKQRLNVIPRQDKRISSLYAVTVQQTAMDKEAYQYWDALKATVSGTGGLFAPMPNEMRGNIVSATFPDEVVLGYINVSTATYSRKFIYSVDVMMYRMTCKETEYPRKEWANLQYSPVLPVRYKETDEGDLNTNVAYWTSSQCADCRLTSNSTRPDYWPQGR